METFLTVTCPTCGRNVMFAPEKRGELTKCRACGFEFIPSLPASITSTYTPAPMGPPGGPPEKRDPTKVFQMPHRFYILGCPIEIWGVIAALVLDAVLLLQNAFLLTVTGVVASPDRPMVRFYGHELAQWGNLMGTVGILDVLICFGLYGRRDWAYLAALVRLGIGTLFAVATLFVGDFAPVGAGFALIMVVLALSRSAGRL